MRKIMLTSTGLGSKPLSDAFCGLFDEPMLKLNALFIPTAAIRPDAIAVLPFCMKDLQDVGIPDESIMVFDLHRSMTVEELCAFDVVYFTGGSSEYLLERLNATGFGAVLGEWLDRGGVYFGVSAGSIVAANNLPGNLGLLDCALGVHTAVGSACGAVDIAAASRIDLADGQAVLIRGNVAEIIGG